MIIPVISSAAKNATKADIMAITKILAAFTLFVVTFLVGITVHILILDAAFGTDCLKTSFQMRYSIINLPNINLPISAITEKDRDDVKFALKLGVDWVCLSFVQSAQDVREAKELIGGKAMVISNL